MLLSANNHNATNMPRNDNNTLISKGNVCVVYTNLHSLKGFFLVFVGFKFGVQGQSNTNTLVDVDVSVCATRVMDGMEPSVRLSLVNVKCVVNVYFRPGAG